MGDENQIPQAPKPDWIASAISGQLKTPSQLMAAGVKASDFNFDENLDTYWKTPVVQEHFKNDKNSFIDFYSKQKEVYNQTKKSDYELDFNIDVATDKWSRKPLIGFSTKTQIEDPFGRNNFGDYYSPKKFSEREQAIKTGVKIGDEYIPVAQYKGDIKLAKDEFGNYKRDSHNRTYWEPIKADEEFRSFDESYDSFAHNMGIYGLNPSYLSEGFYTVVKSVPNFINSTSSSLLEFPRVFGADVSGIQNQLKQNLLPSSDRTKENFFSPVHLAELGLDSVMQLFSMGAVGKVAGALSGSAKTASAAGRIYMTGMAAGPMAQISRENNLSPVETAILYGANAAAIYKLSGLSDMIVRGIRPLELEKIIAPKLAQDYGVTIAKKGFTESALKSFQNRVGRTFESALISLSSKPYVKTSFLEGIEEMGEQTVDTGIRGLHNVMAELLPLQGRFQWDLGREVEAILQSGAGGAFGGAIAHPILKKLSNYDRELVDSFEAAVAFNDEGFVHKMINDWEKAGRLSKDGKTGDENTRNATALREILNTMSTIRDRAGITDAIKNNEKKAGIFADILKSSSIGRDKIILQNELATLTNQLENAEKADDKQLIENLTKQVEAKKAEISEFNSGSQVSRYITEGLYNVESNPHLKSTVIDSSDLGIEGLTEFGLRNNDHFNGKLFTLMNTDSRNNRDRLKSEVSKRNQELIQNSAKANLDNFNELDITPDAKQRLLDEANARRNQEVENYKNSGVDNIINEIFADDEDFDASLVHTSNPEFSFRFSQEVLKRAVEPYKNEEWYAKVAPLFAAEELVNKVSQKKTYKTAPDIEGDSHLYYDFENGKSTVPLESKLEELARAAGQLTGTPKEESDRLSKMFVSPEPDRIIQVIDDRISQVLGNYALKNKKGYNEIISAEVYDTKNALLTLATLKGQFAQLKALSDENEKNTDARILQVYIKSLEKQFNVLQNFVKLLETDIPKIGEIFSEHEVEMQEALDKQDYISYRRESLQVDKKMFDFVRSQRTEVLQKLQKTFKGGDPELLSDEGILAKNTYDYARAVLSNDPTKFVQAAREVIAELKPDVKTPTREHQLVAELALRNAMAGNYDFRVKNSSRELFHLSYTSAVNGGPGTGKTVTEIPFIAAMINKMTGGNVIVTAYKDPSGKKIQKVRSDVEKFFKGKPDFIQHSDSSLIDILKSNEVKNVSAIIFDEAALLSASELNKINTELLRVNQSRPNNPVHLIYTYDEAQNGFREKNSKTTYSITSPVISVPSTPRLTFSFRSVNNPLKALENALRNSQFSNALPSNIALNYDKDFNGVRFVSNKEELEKLVVDLATKLKSEKNLSSMVYINANPENTAVSSASALSLNVLDSVQSQGDEWDYVVVDTSDGEIFGSSIRQKEVYTAVTRAKKGVIVYASPSMPVSSVEGVVKEFKPMTPPEISQQTMLGEIDSILQGQTIDSSFNPAETIKTPSQAVPPVVQTPTTTETSAPSPVSQDDLEMADYRRIMNAMTNTENRVLLNTFYDVQGELEIKKSILFNPSVRDNSNYQVTIAKIGSPGYVADARIDSSKFNGKYAIFLEAVTPDNKRAVLGVIYRAGGEKVETTLRNLNIITQGETKDIVATYPVSNNILRAGQFFHPFIENESSSKNVSPDGNKQSEAVDKKTYSNILSEAKSKGIAVSPILIATADIINSKGKVSVLKGEPFVALSYKHSARQMYNNEFDVLGDDIKTMTLNRESLSLDQIVELLSPFYSRNQKGYYEATSAEFKNLYNSFWQSPRSKGKRLYEEIFNNVKQELSKKDPQVDMFLKKMDVERKAHEVILANGKKIRVEGGYPVEYLLDDYVKISLEKDAKKLLNMNSEPKRKLLMAMMENKAFSRGLRFSPVLSKGSSGFEQNLYAQSVPYQENFLNRVISANYFKLDLPKIQIPIEAVLSEISTQNKEAAPVQPVGKTVQQTVQQSVQESVQGPAISVNPISIVEFRRREFPNQPNLARKAIDKFKKDVVASHLVLTVPEGGTPRILDANEAMTNLKKIYLSNGNLMSQKTNTESRIQYALGSNFNGLLAQYFPSIKYNSSKDEYYYGNDLSKSGSFAEKEMENLLGDGMNSIVKTYLYNTRLANGNYITSKNISNVLKLIKNNTNSDGQAIRTLDEIAEVLSNSSLPEAKAIYKRFFSKSPEPSSVTGSQTNNLTYSTRGVETPAGQNLTNAILSFLTKGQVYSPGFVDVNVYYDENTSSEQRTAKLPIGGFNPQYIKTQFLDKFARILSTGRISVSNGDVNLNGQLYTVEKNVTPENALRMLKGMGFEGFTSEMLQDAIAVDPTILGQIQDYFFASVKNYNKKQASLPSLGLVMDKIIEQFVSAKGLGNDFSFKDGTGKRQYGLRDSAPIFHLKHVVSSAQKSPLLQTNLLVDGNSSYGISSKPPFTHLGFKINKNGFEFTKSVSQLTVPELLDLYLIEGYVTQIENGRNEATFPITVYADASQEISPIFYSNNFLQPAEKTLGDLFDSRTKYYAGLEFKILNDYREVGISAKSIGELNSILSKLTEDQINTLISYPNMVSGVHYNEKSVKGPLSIKQELIDDINMYMNPANKQAFIDRILADAQKVVEYSKNQRGGGVTLYNQIAITSSKATPEEFIKTFYANWLLFSGEFQHLMNGPKYQYKESGQKAFIDMVKRSKSLISPESYFILRNKNWAADVALFRQQNPGKPLPYSLMYEGKKLSRVANVMRFEDPINNVLKFSNGQIVSQKWMDGATLVTPFTRIKQNYSSALDAGPFVGPVMKNITHSNDFESGTKSFVKNAEFEITPYILENGNEFVIEKFVQMTSAMTFPEVIQVNGESVSNAYQLIIALGMNPNFSNATKQEGIFEKAMDIMVENGFQDYIVDEAIFQSSEKTGQRGVNKLSDPNPKVSTIDITMKGIQQDGAKDPSQGMEVNVLTQLVNAIAINWVNSPVLKKFYDTLSDMTKSYIQELSKMKVAERVKYFSEIMREDLLSTDGSNYRTDAASVNRLSINDRTIAPKYTQTIATNIRNSAVAFGLQGGHFVIHPSLMDVYEVEEISTEEAAPNTSEIQLDEPRFNPDNFEATSYPIKINGKYAGVISVDKNGYISSSIGMAGVELEKEFQGKGYGTKVYIALAEQLAKEGKTLKSEAFGKADINKSANKVWKSLLDKGYAIDKGSYFEVQLKNKQQAQQLYSQYAEVEAKKADIERIEIPRYFTFRELGGAKGKSGKALSSVEADKNNEIAENFKKQLQEGDKLIEPNGRVTYFRNGKVVKADGSMRGMVDIPDFINGVIIERSKVSVSDKKADIEKSKTLTKEYGEVIAPEGVTVEQKLSKIGKFFKDNFGWNITYIKASKEDNRVEFTIDGKQINLPEGATIRLMGGQVYAAFTIEDVINAKYDAELAALSQPQAGQSAVKPTIYEINNPAEYTNHSGGALGADSIWDDEGRKVGVVNHQHYYYGNKTPKGNVLLTKEQLQEGIAEMRKAAVVLGKNPQKTETINLLARNWFQVKNSEQIVAVAPISEDMKTVEGGTGWAVAMGQANNREIHVFNQKDNNWYTWNGQMFVQSAVPVLKKNFAGIGTRQITEQGKQAIRDVYANTFAQPQANITTKSPVKRILLKSQVRNLDTQKYKITSRRLKWQSPVREDGVSLTEMYETGIDQETINNSLRNDKWSKGFAEILLPAEMFEDFELDDVIANNIPIDEINERYFLQKLLTPDEFNSKIISDNKKKRAKLMYESFRTRLEGVMARIPTSGKHSAVSTVIAGFFQGSMNSVMVPAELFTVQGADQDYDKGSYVTYQSIKEYTMVDPTVKGGREIKTYDPRNPNYSQFVVKNVRPTGLIPFESNLNEIKSVKNFSKEDLKAIQKIAQKNELARAMNDVLSDSKSLIELNTTLEDVMTELRALKEVILEGSSEEQKLKFDHLMSLLQIHEMNQAGGKNLVGIFANGAKAYNVIYLAKRLKEIKEGKDFSGEPDKIWENFASLISAAVDNANEGVLGPLSFDQITAPYISYLVSTGMSISQIAEYINAKKPFFDAIRKSKEYNSTKGFNINSQPLEMQKLYLYKTEWDVLTQSLINRDIPITMEDIASHILTLENYVNMSYSKAGLQTEPFNFERFFSDDRSYAERQIKLYDSLIATGNHDNNILEIFDNAPHMRAYQEAIAQAHNMFKDIKAYNTIYAVTSENLRNEALLSEPKEGVSINYRYNPKNFTRDYNTVHGMYIHAYLNSRDTSLITTANLGSYEGRIQFINEVNNSLLNLKSKYPDNEFIKDLTLDTNDFTKESKIRMYDFYDMNDDLRALYMEEFQRLEPIDRKRLFIYNLIVTRDRNSKGSFTSLMSIDDKSDYINFLDYEVNIPNKSLADAINQEIANEHGRAKLNNLAIPYSDFKFEKNPAKLVGKKTYISKDFKEPINVEYVTYINKLSISPYAAAVIMVNNNPVVRVDKKVLEVNFRMKRWTSPVKLADGTYSTALPYNAFETLEQYENFNIEYEYLAFKNSQMPVNDRIQRALMNVGKNKFVPYTTNKETENNMAKCSIKVYDEVSGSYVNPR